MKKKKHQNPHDKVYYGDMDGHYDEALANSPIEPEDAGMLEIDEHDLVREWQKQPKLFYEHATQLAQARSDLDYAEAEFKVTKAEIDSRIRKNPGKYGLADKPTEVSIANTILLQPKHQKAQQKVNIAQAKVNMLDATVRSLDHKKSALENMVRLHGQEYYATPTATAEDSATLDEQRKRNVRRK